MTLEKWLIHPGDTRVIDLDDIQRLKISLIGGQVDVVVHDEPGVRIEVHGVTEKDLRIESSGDLLEIDHVEIRWDNFLEAFRNFGSRGPKAELSVAVPRGIALTLGVVSATALVSGIDSDARLNTVSGDVLVDGVSGSIAVNAVSGDIQVRDLDGSVNANSVSGDVAVSGRIRRATVDIVKGDVLIDAEGAVQEVCINTVGGDSTVRLDAGYPANYVLRSVSGKVLVDGASHGGTGSNGYVGSVGALDGSFVDVRANSVTGSLTILRRAEQAEQDAKLADAA